VNLRRTLTIRALDRKLMRDLGQMKGQVLAIVAVMGCGLSIFVGATSTHGSLRTAQTTFYAESRFADVFVNLKSAPRALLSRVREIPGVATLQARIQEAVTINVEGFPEPVSGHILSIPEDPRRQALNRLVLRVGHWPERGRGREILASETFAQAHGLKPGDTLEAVLNGREESLTITGLALAPDYIIEMPAGSFFPDNLRFGVFWMPLADLEAAFDLEGAFNSLSLRLGPGALQDGVIQEVDRLLEPYGGLGAYGREDQLSNRFVTDELKQLRVMSFVPPTIFLSVAAYLLNVSLKRLLSLQRVQVAVLKAYGYSTGEVMVHYLKMAAVIVLLGSCVGAGVGSWLGWGMTGMYQEFYRFPHRVYRVDPLLFLLGTGVTTLAGLAGVFQSVRQSASIPPAVAMQPEPPPVYRKSIVEQLGLERCVSPILRMMIRELERRPARALLSAVGIAFACAGLVMGNFGKDSVDYLVDVQFGLAQRYDAAVAFHQPAQARAVHDLKAIDGVRAVEPYRSVPVRIRHGSRSKQTSVQGVPEGGTLNRQLDVERRPVPLPPEGLLVSFALAKTLGVEIGDRVRLEILEGERPRREVVVNGVIEDYEGLSASMRLENLNRLLREGPAISGAYLLLDSRKRQQVYDELKNSPRIAAVNLKQAAMKSFLETIGENMLRMRLFNVTFAVTIAIGVIYNSMRVIFSERKRELATMRVIGFREDEVGSILQGHLAVLVFCAIPLGLGIGTLFCYAVAQALTTDLYRVPFVINRSTYCVAALVVFGAALTGAVFVTRDVRRLDLISVLKARD